MIRYTGSDLVPFIGGLQYDDVKGRQSFVRHNYIVEYSPVQSKHVATIKHWHLIPVVTYPEIVRDKVL
jgi:hypothetical protein